eukprot:GFYU01003805.1.p1 GENE.GFYU01003805.1~~GFYU01003805.1.p1  ORF type:complete len:314 (-),score=51.62 GFYU01003805.1:23-964(-)
MAGKGEGVRTSEGYIRFKGMIQERKINTGKKNDEVWTYYDHGPKDIEPLLLLPGAAGTAESFYKQMMSLTPRGYRVIAVQHAQYYSMTDFINGMDSFLDMLNIDKVHLFGVSLGGFLCQCYTERRPSRVQSLLLCNTFCDSSYFSNGTMFIKKFQYMPEFYLKRILLANFPQDELEAEMAYATDFMVYQAESLTQEDIASRLTLNCCKYHLGDLDLPSEKITIIETFDRTALPGPLKDAVYRKYPDAKPAQLKTGGDFPFLSRADEINMHITVHLRNLGVDPVPRMLEAKEDADASVAADAEGMGYHEDITVE